MFWTIFGASLMVGIVYSIAYARGYEMGHGDGIATGMMSVVLSSEQIEAQLDSTRLDYMEAIGRWADEDQFLIQREESWCDGNLRRAIDSLMEGESEREQTTS